MRFGNPKSQGDVFPISREGLAVRSGEPDACKVPALESNFASALCSRELHCSPAPCF